MSAQPKDPTEPIRDRASRFPGVDEGTACTQTSFKAAGKAFLFIGMQGGRYKAMFRLKASLPAATRLAQEQPENYAAGSTGWVTARFSAEKPMPKRIWTRWLEESYELSIGARSAKRKAAGEAPVGKVRAKPAAAKKPTARKKAPRKRS